MAKNVLQSTILSTNGGVSVAPGASIEIRNAASGLLVPLWLDRDGTQPTSNPFTADSNGFFRVYLDAGRYHITASKDGKSQEWRDVVLPPDLYIGKSTTAPAAPITGSLLSGAMLAAGAIVEMGENANGQYVRWESGLQVCARNETLNSSDFAGPVGSAFGLPDAPFPASFSSAAITFSSVGVYSDNSGLRGKYSISSVPGGQSWSRRALTVLTDATVLDQSIQITLFAIGAWK